MPRLVLLNPFTKIISTLVQKFLELLGRNQACMAFVMQSLGLPVDDVCPRAPMAAPCYFGYLAIQRFITVRGIFARVSFVQGPLNQMYHKMGLWYQGSPSLVVERQEA